MTADPIKDIPIKDIKDEIRFFMERSYQASFAYVAALVAASFSIKLEVLAAISSQVGVDKWVILASIFLLTNFIFLTINLGCSFAVIKRGIFIVASADRNSPDAATEWEVFLRERAGRFTSLGWNTDNIYLAPIDVVVSLLSFLIFGYEVRTAVGDGAAGIALLGVPMALHAWPLWAFIQLVRLMRVHARLLREFGPVPQTARLE